MELNIRTHKYVNMNCYRIVLERVSYNTDEYKKEQLRQWLDIAKFFNESSKRGMVVVTPDHNFTDTTIDMKVLAIDHFVDLLFTWFCNSYFFIRIFSILSYVEKKSATSCIYSNRSHVMFLKSKEDGSSK